MSAEKVTYLDSSAIVKLVVQEQESTALRAHLRRRRPLVSSALARTEVLRALLPFGDDVTRRGVEVLQRIDLARISDRILTTAAALQPPELRSLDAKRRYRKVMRKLNRRLRRLRRCDGAACNRPMRAPRLP